MWGKVRVRLQVNVSGPNRAILLLPAASSKLVRTELLGAVHLSLDKDTAVAVGGDAAATGVRVGCR